MYDPKLIELLEIVIENYIHRGEPIGSKFLHSFEDIEYAPSTLRKYLNFLEKEGFLYQPYNSAGRVPTIKGIKTYIEDIIKQSNKTIYDNLDFDVGFARSGLRFIVENLSEYVDGIVVGFLKDDEYYFLGISKLLKDDLQPDMESFKHIVKFIEEKQIVSFLDKKIIKRNTINYDFIQDDNSTIFCFFTKIDINGFDGIVSIVGPLRMDYKKNFYVIKNFLQKYTKNQIF